jgi:hypothetical protein
MAMALHGLSAVERACERATLAQLDVVGQGRMRDRRRFFLVPSSADKTQPARLHVVTLQRSRHPHCDCGRPVCDHVEAVLMALVAEASERQRFAELVEAALTSEIPSPEFPELGPEKAARDWQNDRRDADRWELIEAGNW